MKYRKGWENSSQPQGVVHHRLVIKTLAHCEGVEAGAIERHCIGVSV